MTFFILWVGLAIVVGVVAASRGRSGGGWFVLSLLVSPAIAGIVFALAELGRRSSRHAASRESKCPHCAGSIDAKAIVCHHCRREIPIWTFPARPIRSAAYPVGIALSVMVTGMAGGVAFGGYALWSNLFRNNSADHYQLSTFAAEQLQSADSEAATAKNPPVFPAPSESAASAGTSSKRITEQAKADLQKAKSIEVRRRASQNSAASEQKPARPAPPAASAASRVDAAR
jgi:hypothetical protein